jgi:endonuclease YncB( thermonuclease family)
MLCRPVGQDGQPKIKNISEMLVERGLAVAQSHRSDDERSMFYEAYIEAENRAKKSKKGVQVNKFSFTCWLTALQRG